ncbi:MAG: AmmeMemoRadiSam system radical SAM enzyme [Acholeplasmataceae bacterium]
MKEAILYDRLDRNKVRCKACNLRCVIPEGKRGICKVRENRGGTLYSLNYGLTIAQSIDPIEKKPIYHFHPGSRTYSIAAMGCNMRCPWCQNYRISQVKSDREAIKGIEISPQEHVRRARSYGIDTMAYTYTEPTIFIEYALDTMKEAKKHDMNNVWVSNGYMTPEALDAIMPYLDAINIDYKGDLGVYRKYCNGSTEPIMKNMEKLYRSQVHLEVTTLVIPHINDQQSQLETVAEAIATRLGKDVPWHISRFHPAWKMNDATPTPRETLDLAYKIGKRFGIRTIHIGNVF